MQLQDKTYEDKTYEELLPQMEEILEAGGTFWGKFSCQNCGSRQTFGQKNTLFTRGKCEECGNITHLDRWGLVVMYAL